MGKVYVPILRWAYCVLSSLLYCLLSVIDMFVGDNSIICGLYIYLITHNSQLSSSFLHAFSRNLVA